jgi:hypothetical protein
VSILSSNLNGKRQEILIEAVPTARVIAVLADANIPITPSQLQVLQDAMGHRGVDLVNLHVSHHRRDRACDRRGQGHGGRRYQRAGLSAH